MLRSPNTLRKYQDAELTLAKQRESGVGYQGDEQCSHLHHPQLLTVCENQGTTTEDMNTVTQEGCLLTHATVGGHWKRLSTLNPIL